MNKLLELVMIVRNSGDSLRHCLQNNKQFIDHWTIVDTGSTDETKQIILEEMKDVPGNLYKINFADFSQARNKSLDLSSKSCKYTIILDDSYIIHGGDKLRRELKKTKTKCFSLKIGIFMNRFLSNSYYSNRIFKTSENFRYKYRVHEILDVKQKDIHHLMNDDDIFIHDNETYQLKNRSIRRYHSDIKLLLLDLKVYPHDPRILYYIAKTYYNLEKYDESRRYYKILRNYKNIHQEYLFAAIYDVICIKFIENKSDDHSIEEELIQVQNIFRSRVEPCYKLAILYKNAGKIEQADKILSTIINSPKPNLIHTNIEPDVYDFLIPYLYIEVKLQLGKLAEGVKVLQAQLQKFPLNQPLLNIKYALHGDSMNISSISLSTISKTIVFHTGGEQAMYKNWNPRGDTRISGSEYMAMNLAKEFVAMGYRVFVIGSFTDENSDIDHQCIHEKVEYIDYKYFQEFALKYVIDYLVILRYTENLVYYDNIKNVFLWVHDVLPITNSSICFQTHQTKFRKIIAISNWQKHNIASKMNLPEELFVVSRNAIYTERFLTIQDDVKTPYRFIYSSDPSRGLSVLIDVMETIKQKYQETTLYIYCIKENIDYDTLQKIDELNQGQEYIFIKNRLNQDELAKEFLRSDIWLYPCQFLETYCITFLEATLSKCLVATVKLAGLGELADGKAILCDAPIEKNIDDLLQKLFFVMERPLLKQLLIERAYTWGIEQTYTKLAETWREEIL